MYGHTTNAQDEVDFPSSLVELKAKRKRDEERVLNAKRVDIPKLFTMCTKSIATNIKIYSDFSGIGDGFVSNRMCRC